MLGLFQEKPQGDGSKGTAKDWQFKNMLRHSGDYETPWVFINCHPPTSIPPLKRPPPLLQCMGMHRSASYP